MAEYHQIRAAYDRDTITVYGKLDHRAIQVGISRHPIEKYVSDWIVDAGRTDRAKPLLPKERVYPVPADIAKRLAMSS